MKKVICFARVSTIAQDLQPQLDAVKRQIIADNYEESEIVVVKGKESAIKLKEEYEKNWNRFQYLVRIDDITQTTKGCKLIKSHTYFEVA